MIMLQNNFNLLSFLYICFVVSYDSVMHLFQLLGDILLDRSNSGVMIRYVSSRDNLRILMNLLRVRLPSLLLH